MNRKVKGSIAALLVLVVVVYLNYTIYYAFPGTPATIFMLLLSFTGVLLAVGFYRRFTIDPDKNKKHIYATDLPEIEPDVLYVSLEDFVAKYEKVEGNLFLAGEKINQQAISLKEVNFDKLLDEFYLQFSGGIKFSCTDLKTIGVGDNQFVIYGFDQAILSNKDKRRFKMSNKSVYELVKDEQVLFTLPKGYPVFVFTWLDLLENQ